MTVYIATSVIKISIEIVMAHERERKSQGLVLPIVNGSEMIIHDQMVYFSFSKQSESKKTM